jgi:hypothetical protein
MKRQFSVGDLTIHRIIEQETTFLQAPDMLPDLTPDILAENRAWMKQVGALDDTDTFKSGPPASRHRRPPYWQRTALLE